MVHWRNMKKLLLLSVAAILIYSFVQGRGIYIPSFFPLSQSSDSSLQNSYNNRQNDHQIQGQGVVTRILPDDVDGSRHQRFILELSTGQTLLIAHNIDLAPRVASLNIGDTVSFYGEYEWNPKGGVIHWTHHDPNYRHVGGWLRHGGKKYE
jgi:hypothetical protein